MKIEEPLSLRVAKTLVNLLGDSHSSVSVQQLSFELKSSPEDLLKIIDKFTKNGTARLMGSQIYLTEEGLSKVA